MCSNNYINGTEWNRRKKGWMQWGDGQKERWWQIEPLYSLAANKITREWKHGERCEDLWWRSSNHPGPGALWGAAGALISAGNTVVPANDAPDGADKVTHSHRGQTSASFLLRHMGKLGKEWGYGSLLTKSEDFLENFCCAPGKGSCQLHSTMLGKW